MPSSNRVIDGFRSRAHRLPFFPSIVVSVLSIDCSIEEGRMVGCGEHCLDATLAWAVFSYLAAAVLLSTILSTLYWYCKLKVVYC